MTDHTLGNSIGPENLADGRQSETAAAICQGVRRLFRQTGIATVCELVLANGRRADIAGVSPDGAIHIVEVKSSIQDFRADKKWTSYIEYCDYFYFASLPTLDSKIFPAGTGIIAADQYGAAIIEDAPLVKLAPARRKQFLLRFSHHAANYLHALQDPEIS